MSPLAHPNAYRPAVESTTPPFSTNVTIERADPRDFRDEVIALHARNGSDVTSKLFDWYYSDNGQGRPVSWLARHLPDRRIVGMCSVVPRTFRISTTLVRAGVAGNLLVDAESRNTLVVLHLLRATKALVLEDQVDVLLGTPNKLPQTVAVRMGFHQIDHWRTYAQIFHSRQPLRYRYGWLGTLASPGLDIAAALCRLRSNWYGRNPRARFRMTRLAESRLEEIADEAWTDADHCLKLQSSAAFLHWRFNSAPHKSYQLLGLDPANGGLCGYLAVHPVAGRVHVCECRTDARRLSEADAILQLCHDKHFREATVWVTTLRGSHLAQRLADWGFVPVPPSFGGCALALLGFWRSDHHLAHYFAQPSCWNTFVGFNDV